jgi:hypothetical protein
MRLDRPAEKNELSELKVLDWSRVEMKSGRSYRITSSRPLKVPTPRKCDAAGRGYQPIKWRAASPP